MQNGFFQEVEAAYMRHRIQEAVVASGLAAQAVRHSTRNRRRLFPNLAPAGLRAHKVLERLRPMPGLLPRGKEFPAAQG